MPETPKTNYLKEYLPPNFSITSIDLKFSLLEDCVNVTSTMQVKRLSSGGFLLHGSGLKLNGIWCNGRNLHDAEYDLLNDELVLQPAEDSFELVITTEIRPQENASLEGLYSSNGIFCTQCEAEGFRRITYFPDRPDVMTVYTTTIEADCKRYPVLLANGNLVDSGQLPDNRHFAVWQDPFPKPCYLFALVAGDLARIKDSYTTKSGRSVALEIYVEHHNSEKCAHAMRSLQKAMQWDEDRFGLEYDLDQYMIVAVDDFNAGAMENKGLNVFNSKYILAKPQTATDSDYEGIESVVAHEYFHNWTGNRVTCRDWFQLSLKEGLTVFRDQEFSSDIGSRAVKRISDVVDLRTHQFPEDAGPMAHPVRPESYIEVNNFYTLTVYEKGAEVIRMLHTILGEELFAKGLNLYLSRHDGQAVTTEDFVQAMADILAYNHRQHDSGNLEQFKRWYCTAGTPTLKIVSSYDADTKSFTLQVEQELPSVAASDAEMLFVPLGVGLLGREGQALPMHCSEVSQGPKSEQLSMVLPITKAKQLFTFKDVPCAPVPSLLRGFSAPVKLEYDYSEDDLYFLLAHDSDPFCRWEAGQRLFVDQILGNMDDIKAGRQLCLDQRLVDFFRQVLTDNFDQDKRFCAQIITLPAEQYLAELVPEVDVDAIHGAREFIRQQMGKILHSELTAAYNANTSSEPYRYDPQLAGNRRYKHLCLHYLMAAHDPQTVSLCVKQLQDADNMTDEVSALQALVHGGCAVGESALDAFLKKWQNEALVMDKWFSIQASAPLSETLQRVKDLTGHPNFSIKNPNKVRALIGAFAMTPVCFHAANGEGYRFLADKVLEIDQFNANIAARLLGRFSRWRKYDQRRQEMMKNELNRIVTQPSLSKGSFEVASKSLA